MPIPRAMAWVQLCLLRLIKNTRSSGVQSVRLIAPRSLIFCRDEFPLVSYKEVFVDRSYEPPVSLPLRPRILDIGGHLGMATLYFARRFWKPVIDVYEANPEAYALLQKTFAHEQNAEIRIHGCAVGPIAGSTQLFVADGPRIPTDASVVREAGNKRGHLVTVPMEDIRSVAAGKIDLIKIDIEGLEYDCLEALKPSPSLVRAMVIEFHDCPGQSERLNRQLGALRAVGYQILDEHLNDLTDQNIFKSDTILVWAVSSDWRLFKPQSGSSSI